MINRYVLYLFICLAFVQNAYPMAIELSGDYGFSKRIFGSDKDYVLERTSYSGKMAFYFFFYTALEFNYSKIIDVVENSNEVALSSNIAIEKTKSQSITDAYGIGLKQALNSPRGFLVPSISFGYAKMYKESDTTYTINVDGTINQINVTGNSERQDSSFGEAALKINLTRFMYLEGSIKTIVRGLKFEEAKDFIIYGAGISWII